MRSQIQSSTAGGTPRAAHPPEKAFMLVAERFVRLMKRWVAEAPATRQSPDQFGQNFWQRVYVREQGQQAFCKPGRRTSGLSVGSLGI